MSKKYEWPSEEWGRAVHEALNANKEWSEASKEWLWDIKIVCTDLPEDVAQRLGSKTVGMYFDLHKGESRSYEFLPDPSKKETVYTYEGTYEIFGKVLRGELDANQAIMARKIKVKGDLLRAMRFGKATAEFVKTMISIPI